MYKRMIISDVSNVVKAENFEILQTLNPLRSVGQSLSFTHLIWKLTYRYWILKYLISLTGRGRKRSKSSHSSNSSKHSRVGGRKGLRGCGCGWGRIKKVFKRKHYWLKTHTGTVNSYRFTGCLSKRKHEEILVTILDYEYMIKWVLYTPDYTPLRASVWLWCASGSLYALEPQ